MDTTTSTLTWYTDPGHGWLEVPLDTCAGLNISAFSYVDRARGLAYLEEDCDAGLWLRHHDRMNARHGFPVRHTDGDSFVRGLPRFGGVA